MQFYFNADGTLIQAPNDEIYQGSANAHKIYFIAPISTAALVTVGFRLPNGYRTYQYAMALCTATGMNGMQNEQGVDFSMWEWTATEDVSAYAGTGTVQFFVRTNGSATQATFTADYTIQGGTMSSLPSSTPSDVWQSFITAYNAMAGKVTTLESTATTHDSEISDLQETLYGEAEEGNERFRALFPNLQNGEGLIDIVKTSSGAGEIAATALRNSETAVATAASAKSTAEATAEGFGAMDDRLDTVEAAITQATEDITDVQGDITDIQDDITTIEGDIDTIEGDITDIQDLIPSQASPQNQLADKEFVNSTVGTNTSNFIGTFESISALLAYSGTVTNNDYAYVMFYSVEEPTQVEKYNRYKYNANATNPNNTGDNAGLGGTHWFFEYALNNSSFTAAQWAAINSGITALNKVVQDDLAVTPTAGKAAKFNASGNLETGTATQSGEAVNKGQMESAIGALPLPQTESYSSTTFDGVMSNNKVYYPAANVELTVFAPTFPATITPQYTSVIMFTAGTGFTATMPNNLTWIGADPYWVVGKAYRVTILPSSDLATYWGVWVEQATTLSEEYVTLNTVNLAIAAALANYYTKTQTYSKSEVNSLIANIQTVNIEVVQSLPTANASTYFNTSKTVYLTPNSSPANNNYYDEYITQRSGVEGSYTYSWECIGSTAVDLSNYYTKTESDNRYVQKTTTIAGIDLQDNITKQELADALGVGIYPTIAVAVAQIAGAGNDAYTTAQYIRFAPTAQQAAILMDESIQIIKLDLTALGTSAPAPYVWLRRNTVVELPNPLDPTSTIPAYQFTCGGEQFWYENYQTDITIKNIGNAALVYVEQLILDPALTPHGVADITLLNVSIPDLYKNIGNKLDKVSFPNKIYGTDSSGEQATYDLTSFSRDLNLENGIINGTLTQKNLSYNQMIEDFEPNMVAYVSYIGAGVSSPTSEQLIALLNSDKTNPYVAGILGDYTFEQYCAGFLAGTGSVQPGVSNKTAVDALVTQQLSERCGVSSSDDLSNFFGAASDGAVGLGFKNKLYSPAAITLGFDNQAGDEGYPSESIGAIAIGYRVKSLGNQTSIIGKQSVFKVSDYSGEEYIAAEKYRQNRLQAKSYLQSIGSDAVSLFPENASTDILYSGTAKGENSHVLGGSTAIGKSAVALNDNNIAIGDNSQVAGNQNIALAPDGFTTGLQNYVYQGAMAAITGGGFNINTGRSSLVVGEGNLNRGIGSIVSGYQCQEDGSDAIMQGLGLFGGKDYSAIFGKYNKVNRIVSYKTTYQTELPGSCVLLKVSTGTHYSGSIDVALRVTFKTLPDKGGFNIVGCANPELVPAYLTWSNSFVDNVFTPANFQVTLAGLNYTWLGLSTRNKDNVTYEISKVEVNINNEGWQEVALQDPIAYQSTVSVEKFVDYLFAIGNGTAETTRSNAFEVTDTGVARAYGTPVGNNDLTPKSYVDALRPLSGAGAPTSSTVANYVGQLYTNTTNNDVYVCYAITTSNNTTTYSWKPLGNKLYIHNLNFTMDNADDTNASYTIHYTSTDPTPIEIPQNNSTTTDKENAFQLFLQQYNNRVGTNELFYDNGSEFGAMNYYEIEYVSGSYKESLSFYNLFNDTYYHEEQRSITPSTFTPVEDAVIEV